MSINPKLCECGCGRPTRIAPQTKACYGHVKGQPMRFVRGHKQHHTLAERFAAKTMPATDLSPNGTSGCIVWTGALVPKGYGSISRDGTRRTVVAAHRIAWELAGRIPPGPGLMFDHLCRRRNCVNVDHLEIVTNAENVRRGASTKLTAVQVAEIREMRSQGLVLREIAAQFDVSIAHVHHITTCLAWADAA